MEFVDLSTIAMPEYEATKLNVSIWLVRDAKISTVECYERGFLRQNQHCQIIFKTDNDSYARNTAQTLPNVVIAKWGTFPAIPYDLECLIQPAYL